MSSSLIYDQNTLTLKCEGCDPVSIDRKNLKVSSNAVSSGTTVNFLHLLGAFEVNEQTYLALGTKVETVCEFWDINRITDFKLVRLSQGGSNSLVESLLNQGLNLGPIYYSTSHDLSLSAVLQAEKAKSREHFVWNSRPLEHLRNITGNNSLGLPVITGFIGASKVQGKFTLALISRRSCVRPGTRLWVRGADEEGNVANYVETEQVVQFPEVTYSLVQVRGSVPMVWSQYPNLSRLPNLALADESLCEKTLNEHFSTLYKDYGPITVVSLTDNKGREKEMTNRYNTLGGKAEHVTFQYWDFHHECAKLHYENIDKLVALIQSKIDEIGFSVVKGDSNVDQKQNGVVRTNCVDCLDRTNVVQSVIARKNLEKQLKNHNINSIDDECLSHFRNLWTDNADALSCQYAGTPALKTDYTRTGKRTFKGLIDDGKNAIVRYYVNTCQDGTRQDAYDAITQDVPCKNYKSGNGFFMVLLLAILAFLSFLFNLITQGKKAASLKYKQAKRKAVNYPHFIDVGLNDDKQGNESSK